MTDQPRYVIQGDLTITYGFLFLEDSDGRYVGYHTDTFYKGTVDVVPDFLSRGLGYVRVHSAGHTLLAHVELQAWDTFPITPTGKWDISAETSITLGSGHVTATCLMGDRLHTDIRLGDPGSTSQVRVYCKGRHRARLAEQVEDVDDDEIFEEYLAQFWPSQ